MASQFLHFIQGNDPPLENYTDIPKEMDVFFRAEQDFLPEGKTFEDLTEVEKTELQNNYRFSPYKPGIYQGITWIAKTYKQM